MEGRFYGMVLEIIALKTELVLAFELCMAKTSIDLGILKGEAWMASGEKHMLKTKEDGLDNEVTGLKSEIQELNTKIAEMEAHVAALKGAAAPRLAETTPVS